MENQLLPERVMWVDRVESTGWLPVAHLPKEELEELLLCARVSYSDDKCCMIVSQCVELGPLSVWIQKVHPKTDMKLRPQTPFRNIILHFMMGSDVETLIENGQPVVLNSGCMDMFNLAIYPNEATLGKNQDFTSLHLNIQPKDVAALAEIYSELKVLKADDILNTDGPVNRSPIAVNEVCVLMMRDILTCRYIGEAAHFFLLRTSVNMLAMFEKLMRSPKHEFPAIVQEKIKNCFSFLYNFHMGQLTVKQLSGIIGINANALHEGFLAVFGCTTSQFQYRMRMNAAYRKLVEEGTPVGMVAEMTGFKSVRSFRISFRRYFKCDPLRLVRAQ